MRWGVSETHDVVRWYAIDVTGGVPTLSDQGEVGAGDGTFATYPAIDINADGQIGMTYMLSGLGPGQFMSVYVTGRKPGDAPGTMQDPVLVRAGVSNYQDFGGRAGDLSGIGVDADGSFWAASEYASGLVGAVNWGTAIAHFRLVDAIDSGATDLAVSVDAPAVGREGADVTYTIAVTNLGPNAAADVAVASPLPDFVTFVSGTHPAGWAESDPPFGAGGTVRFAASALAAGASATFTATVHVRSGFSSIESPNPNLASQATVTARTADPVPANDVATALTFVPPLVDMSVAASGPERWTAGTDVTLDLTVANQGPNDAPFPRVRVEIPAGETFVRADVPDDWTPFIVESGGRRFFEAIAFDLFPESSVLITATFHLDPDYVAYPVVIDRVTVLSDGDDPDPSDDAATVSIALAGLADVAVTQAGPASAVAGATASYTIVLANNGPSDAYAPWLTGQVPDRARFVSLTELSGPSFTLARPADGGGGGWGASGRKLAAGESAVFRLVVAVDGGAPAGAALVEQVRALLQTPDPSMTDNLSRLLTPIATKADLSIAAAALGGISTAGGRLTYQVTVANNGPSDALNVTWTDLVPAGASVVAATQTGGPTFTLRKTATGESGSIARLAARAVATFTLILQVPAPQRAGATIVKIRSRWPAAPPTR